LRAELDSLRGLIGVLELISAPLEAELLVQTVMEKSRELTKADRCSIFLLNPTKDRLVTIFHMGLDSPIDLPANVGIVGQAVTRKQVVNVADASKAPLFDSETDRDRGYRTKSLVAVPIYSPRGQVIGASEFLNKENDEEFTPWDVKVIQLFNVICGIALENSRLGHDSTDVQRRISEMLEVAVSLAKSDDLQTLLRGILDKAKALVDADRGSFFTLEPGQSTLASLIVDGANLPATISATKGLVGVVIRTKKPVVENDCYMCSDFNPAIDRASGYRTKSLIALPILDSANAVIGVVELLNKKTPPFTDGDVETVSAFTAFASIAIQNARIATVQDAGGPDVEVSQLMTPAERTAFDIPAKLTLTESEKATVLSMNCFSLDFKGLGHFKECFFFYKLFNFLDTFKLTAQRLYTFLAEISSRYTQTSYHNWTHACDVTQCVTYQLYTGKLGEAYEAWELFTLLTAAVCHDTNHRGLNNVYNVKAETPLGILYKDQSVMEMHHITQAMPVINQENIALFGTFDETQLKKVWTLFVKIILSTDMAQHFNLVKSAQTAIDENSFNMENEDFRVLGLQLIMKVGDISNVARPFDIADKWCDILNVEFFHQGDLEKESGIGLTSPLNDRTTANKPKSQIGFYNFICLPLYTVVANLYPPLEAQVEQVKSNLERWKTLLQGT
jgi:3',5'-cyclic-nucleotide phosphodiesterase